MPVSHTPIGDLIPLRDEVCDRNFAIGDVAIDPANREAFARLVEANAVNHLVGLQFGNDEVSLCIRIRISRVRDLEGQAGQRQPRIFRRRADPEYLFVLVRTRALAHKAGVSRAFSARSSGKPQNRT